MANVTPPLRLDKALGGIAYYGIRFVGIVMALVAVYMAAEFLQPASWITVISPLWHIESNETVVLDSFGLRNTTAFDLKDFVVGCDAKGNSGTTIETSRATVYEVLKKSEEKQFGNLVLTGKYPEQAASVSCRVIEASHIW